MAPSKSPGGGGGGAAALAAVATVATVGAVFGVLLLLAAVATTDPQVEDTTAQPTNTRQDSTQKGQEHEEKERRHRHEQERRRRHEQEKRQRHEQERLRQEQERRRHEQEQRRRQEEQERRHQEEQERQRQELERLRQQEIERQRIVQERLHQERMVLDRESRMKNSIPRKLYHQTSRTGADGIRQSGRMNRGSTGYAGGGIYFATSRQDTRNKAHSSGYMIACYVKLGKIKRINAPDSSITYHSLLMEGYDSVEIHLITGIEYVVYNSDQVEIRKVHKKRMWHGW